MPEAAASDAPATAKERMAAKVRTPEGKALYARRKVIVEPVFGQIKNVRGFRRFLLRGLEKIRGEWRLVCRRIICASCGGMGVPKAQPKAGGPPGDVQCLVGGWRADEKPSFEKPR